jgi:hypothetical protein
MGIESYVIPKGDLTLTQRMAYRSNAIDAAKSRAIALGIATSKDGLDVRPFSSLTDAGAALDQWNTAALAVVGTAYSVFQAIAAPILAANKLAVFFGVGIETVPSPIGLLIFRSGAAAGNIRYQFDLEQLINSEEIDGYFTEPIVYDPTRQFAIQAVARIATGAIARVQIKGFVIEPQGQIMAG